MLDRRPDDSDLRAVPILATLERHGVAYVMVGSFGAIVQGVDLPVTDLDIVPASGEENSRWLVAALRDLNARERRGDNLEDARRTAGRPVGHHRHKLLDVLDRLRRCRRRPPPSRIPSGI